MSGEVKVWYMTEEERLAYIRKHPIVPTEKPRGSSYSGVYDIPSHRERQKKMKDAQ